MSNGDNLPFIQGCHSFKNDAARAGDWFQKNKGYCTYSWTYCGKPASVPPIRPFTIFTELPATQRLLLKRHSQEGYSENGLEFLGKSARIACTFAEANQNILFLMSGNTFKSLPEDVRTMVIRMPSSISISQQGDLLISEDSRIIQPYLVQDKAQ